MLQLKALGFGQNTRYIYLDKTQTSAISDVWRALQFSVQDPAVDEVAVVVVSPKRRRDGTPIASAVCQFGTSRFAATVKLLGLLLAGLADTITTKRDFYYHDVDLFDRTPARAYRLVDLVLAALNLEHRMVASQKGLVYANYSVQVIGTAGSGLHLLGGYLLVIGAEPLGTMRSGDTGDKATASLGATNELNAGLGRVGVCTMDDERSRSLKGKEAGALERKGVRIRLGEAKLQLGVARVQLGPNGPREQDGPRDSHEPIEPRPHGPTEWHLGTKELNLGQEPRVLPDKPTASQLQDKLTESSTESPRVLPQGTSKSLSLGPFGLGPAAPPALALGPALDPVLIPRLPSPSLSVLPHAIVVIEKDAVFKSFCNHLSNINNLPPLLVITGKGFPDNLTKHFLSCLHLHHPSVPILGFVDSDVYGLSILRSYLVYNHLCPLPIRLAGVNLLDHHQGWLPISTSDHKLMVSLLRKIDPGPDHLPWRREISRGLLLRKKSEMNTTDCNAYIGGKLQKKLQ